MNLTFDQIINYLKEIAEGQKYDLERYNLNEEERKETEGEFFKFNFVLEFLKNEKEGIENWVENEKIEEKKFLIHEKLKEIGKFMNKEHKINDYIETLFDDYDPEDMDETSLDNIELTRGFIEYLKASEN